jgi:hypothetical protein
MKSQGGGLERAGREIASHKLIRHAVQLGVRF